MQRDHASSTDSAPAATALLSILLPLPLAGPYDYRADTDLRLERGDFVIVPLGSREVIGVVWGEGSGDVGTAKLRDVVARLEARPLPAPQTTPMTSRLPSGTMTKSPRSSWRSAAAR